MTETQAWLTIAEAYSIEWKDRTLLQRKLTQYGCCKSVIVLFDFNNGLITRRVHNTMFHKIKQCLFVPKRIWFCPPRKKFNHLRAAFCDLMAYACEDE